MVIKLGEMFFDVPGYDWMTFEKFKVWMKNIVKIPEEEWKEPNILFGLDTFTSPFKQYNLEIFEYIVNLGKDCFKDVIYALDMLDHYRFKKYDKKFYGIYTTKREYNKYKIEMIKYFKQKLYICKKYLPSSRYKEAVKLQREIQDT